MRCFAVLALAACTTRTVATTPNEIMRVATELRRDDRATVYATDGNQAEIHGHDRIEVYLDDAGTQHRVHLTLTELVEHCVDDSAARGCAAHHVVEQRIVVRRERHFDSDYVAKMVGVAGLGGIVGYCVATCVDASSAPRALAYTGAAIAGTIGFFALLVAIGGRD